MKWLCGFPNCHEKAISQCENCDTHFCDDHGSVGGDREGGTNPNGSPYGAYAVPSCCFRHGGYNADE